MALPISLYDPMVLIEAAATILTGCYIVKLALLERTELLSSRLATRTLGRTIHGRTIQGRTSQGRTFQRAVRNDIPSSRIIAPLAAPQSSLPVLSPLPMNGAIKKVVRPVTFATARTAVARQSTEKQSSEERNTEQKIVPISASKRGSRAVAAKQLSRGQLSTEQLPTRLLQTDWLQRA